MVVYLLSRILQLTVESRDLSQAEKKILLLKFVYSEKATKFCEISTVDLSFVVTVKSTVEILQNFVAFSEYMNFNIKFIFFLPDFI